MENPSTRDAREAVALACRLYGRARGWHLAAQRLGISERTARGLTYGETNGATIHPDTALSARLDFLAARHAALTAELNQLEAQCAQISGADARACSPGSAGGASALPLGVQAKQGQPT